ncbi:M99 family carboxypeptidase catalytic domain-containing protein [Helicobacter turcicus]|uniref:Succinylglutamate desuccinylase/aspartoacylase family protein n=1 Tax=Helicobacter turcicus TaxID=2867412 RepID=A0ABS7JMS6_9HELI|nr:M99 family carboxypeptidase catalytic domain-containing protein [Helicobacter turcicus]MBX7490698.1 succinylglutamate desuccinylase/aspartoacylase family protein [Helicobacter turcicus]MBX7545693.1 succinylglutamate desuccinylase/aspartoacylase family protein [Helicobacter turcicus]
MKRLIRKIVCVFVVSITLLGAQESKEAREIVVSIQNTKQNTPFKLYTLKGEEEGATLLVIGGIHGDEPGGYFAPALLADFYTIKKGNVLVVPNLNPDSIVAFRRGIYNDMNRKFARISKGDPDFKNVERIKGIIKDSKVDFVINLHDGHGFYRTKWENSIFNPRAWGQTYVIDQKTLDNVPFGNLDSIAKEIEERLNQTLHYDFHTFGVRNTETKFKDEEQQNSLTFFAITHLKPALAIETSKNIKELPLKTLYQLSSIEALMGIMGIEFERNFVLDLKSVEAKVNTFGSVKINDNITLELDSIKKHLNFVPLLSDKNRFSFTHPIGGVKKVKDGFELYIGHKKVTHLKADIFPMQCKLESLEVELDNKEVAVKAGDILEFSKDFLVRGQDGLRVNVIGYSKKGVVSEHNLRLNPNMIDKNYAIDKQGRVFRVELYEGKNFCGMLNMRTKE